MSDFASWTNRLLAVIAGFLVNGHVSFIPMLVIILIAVVTLNWLRLLEGPGDRRILGKTFFVTFGSG